MTTFRSRRLSVLLSGLGVLIKTGFELSRNIQMHLKSSTNFSSFVGHFPTLWARLAFIEPTLDNRSSDLYDPLVQSKGKLYWATGIRGRFLG